ncbi:hypothetical protein NDU88_003166 [Pleurodeles waltl]|uniref:Uncharacterized protein n=1 Tax=Pleurodeles waltl TaxID=8319 RepID=A0AAV7LEL9_PLEWA|nr:hypothetical protein NDU88_003166 [Pleurodeles waltl]
MAERAIRLVKGNIQLAHTNRCDVSVTVSDMVWAHRTTPHSVTQKITFVSMQGRLPGTRLVPAWLKGGWSGNVGNHTFIKSFETQRINAKLRVEVGDWVKVKSGRIQGGLTKFRGPFRVRRVGTFFVILDNGERWNLRNVALYQTNGGCIEKVDESCSGLMFMRDDEVIKGDSANSLNDTNGHGGEDECMGMRDHIESVLEKRVRKAPSYLRDFVR